MAQIWNLLLYQPILNALIALYKLLFSNLGLAIIFLTLIIRILLTPLMSPQMQSAKKMQEMAPELGKLKKKHANDKQKLMQAQLSLYKEHGINPAAGCLPQILQLVILITLYQVFNQVIHPNGAEVIQKINERLYDFNRLPVEAGMNLQFLYLDLGKPDLVNIPGFPTALPGAFVLLATVFQFLSSKLMMPAVKKQEKVAAKTEEKSDDMASSMQKQMLYLFPAMTLVFGFTLPAGVMLYWFIFSFFTYIHQRLVNQTKKGAVPSRA